MTGLFELTGKTALVTGGSRGIGRMIAHGLVQAGVRVAISSRKAEDLKATEAELAAVGDCRAIPADLSTPEGARGLQSPSPASSTGSTSSSTTPVRLGARRSRSSRPRAGTA